MTSDATPAPDRLDSLIAELRAFVCERDWEQFHDPKNLAMCLASEAGELLAEYRWVKADASDALSGDQERMERVRKELGDVAIALLLLCDRLGLDLVNMARDKLALNALKYPVGLAKGRADPPLETKIIP